MKKSFPFLIACTVLLTILFIGCNLSPVKEVFLTVEASLCLGCGECTKVCKADAIMLVGNKAVIDLTKCIHCGRCVKVCPNDAIY